MFNPLLLEAHNPGPMTGRGNNTYLLIGADRAVLIDAGVGEPRHLEAIDRELTAQRAQLDDVVVTHAHPDHATGAPALHAAHRAASFRKYPWPEKDQLYAVRWQSIGDGDRIQVGDDQLEVIHTPGHSPDHITLWHASSRTAFTGDLVVAGSSVVIEATRGGDLREYLASLQRILALGAERLLPAHGPAVGDPAALIGNYLAHRRQREEQVLAALANGRESVESIADYIYDGLAPALRPAAEQNVRAHLLKLEAEGHAAVTGGRWKS